MALSIVYAPQGATTSPAVDIVAVHGLGGDAIDTWTHPKSKAFWLKDFLPKQIPDARVMTFSYNAAAAFGQSTAEVIDHAKSLLTSLVDKREESEEAQRPLIFVAHSLGGIVVKQALLQTKLEPLYQSIKDATLGIIFLGTPHRGSDKATYGKVLATVAQFMSHRPPPRLVTALQTNSDVLLRLTSDFRFQLPDYQIVEKHSALLETNHEEQIPVDADHSAMCKFETEADDTFEKAYKRVKRMKNTPRRVANEQSVPNNKHFEVPYLLSPVFTGRDDVLERLTTSFTAKRPSQHQHQQRFVLFGLGGSGKTQICLKYIQEHRERYWAIFWVDASSDNRVQQCFTQMARLLQVDEEVDSVKRKLANTSQTWLLIFDNADNPNLKLAPYFPAGDRGDIIIISRNPQHQHYSTVGFQEVTRLSLHDSILLLTKVVYGEIDISPRTSEERKTIVEVLGGHALAIVQAGAYIRETSCSLPDYLEIYQRRKKDLLEHLPTHLGTDYQHSVYTTWQVSVDMIESMRDTVSHSSLRLLSLLGFYHHDQVPVQMFYHAWQNLQANQDLPDYLPWRDAVSDFFDYRQSVQASITLLGSFSLVTRNAEFSLSLHPLVHDWCRERMSVDEQQSNYRRALSLLTSSVTWEFQSDDYTLRRLLVSHVHELLRLLAQCSDMSEEDKMRQWPLLALILAENGWTKDALPLAEEVVELYKSKLGGDHPNTLRSMHSLASRYSEAGRWSEALQLTEEVLTLRKSKLGEDHPDTLASIGNLANRYSEVGRRPEALQLGEEVVKLLKSKLGDDHPDTLKSIHNLAIRYSEAGRQAEALQLMKKVVELRKSKLGEDHPETLGSIDDLANMYSEAGRGLEALQLGEEVVKLRKSKLGEDHPDTLKSMHNLAIQYSWAGRRSEALQLTEEVLKLQKSKLGEDHPDTLVSMHNLAIWYSVAGRRSDAIQLTEMVLKLHKGKLGEDHPETLTSMYSLAIQYSWAGRQVEALQLTKKVVELRKSKLGEDHPDTAKSTQLRAYILEKIAEASP